MSFVVVSAIIMSEFEFFVNNWSFAMVMVVKSVKALAYIA